MLGKLIKEAAEHVEWHEKQAAEWTAKLDAYIIARDCKAENPYSDEKPTPAYPK